MPAPSTVTKARLINFNLIVFAALLEWIWATLSNYVCENPYNLTAAVAASMLIRMRVTNLSAARWFGGFVSGIVFAALFAGAIHKSHPFLARFESWQIWAAVAFVGDAIVLLFAGTQQLGQKVGSEIVDNPGQSFKTFVEGSKEVLTLGERAGVLLAKFKIGAASLLSTVGEFFAGKINGTKKDE